MFEQALEMVFAEMYAGRNLIQTGLLLEILFQKLDGLFDAPVILRLFSEIFYEHAMIVVQSCFCSHPDLAVLMKLSLYCLFRCKIIPLIVLRVEFSHVFIAHSRCRFVLNACNWL